MLLTVSSIYTVLSFKFDQKEWNTTCSEPTTFIQHEDFSDSFSSTYIDTFLFTMGTIKSPFRCFISTLLSSWLQHLWVVFFWNLQAQVFQLLGPGSCFLLASKSGFSHLKHVSPSQGESVFPTHAETLLFSIPHQLVQVNSEPSSFETFKFHMFHPSGKGQRLDPTLHSYAKTMLRC